MSKISREDNKKRYKTGMYPTQQDFENVFDSYVHKDDTIDPSKIVSGDENIVDIINRKAEEKHSHEIKDVDGLGKFITEMTSLLEIVRDPETGEISQSKLQALTEGIAALRDDIDTNADNVAGHESRIQTNEAALEKVYQILGKDAKESIADLAARFTALSGNYANVYAFINKVKQFLEDADASDETINRWQEIETFLQGITDTETLTGLLEQQRTDLEGRIAEAIAAIPQGNYLKLVPDLDAYTDAPDGEIVKYTGETNDKYTHGFDYERKAGDAIVIPADTAYVDVKNPYSVDEMVEFVGRYYKSESCDKFVLRGNGYALLLCNAATPKPGDLFVSGDGLDSPVEVASVQDTGSSYVVALVGSTDSRRSANIKTFDKNPTFQNKFVDCNGHSFYATTDGGYAILNNFKFCTYQYYTMGTTDTSTTIGSPASWQLCHSMPVIQ